MEEVRRRAESPDFPAVRFLHQASVEAGDTFFAKRAPDAVAIADSEAVLFDAFRLPRGGLREMAGLSVWMRGLAALLKGNFVGAPTSDTLRMPGAFLVDRRDVHWVHRAKHAGDLPDLDAVARVARQSLSEMRSNT